MQADCESVTSVVDLCSMLDKSLHLLDIIDKLLVVEVALSVTGY